MRSYFLAATAAVALMAGYAGSSYAGVETADQARAKPSAVMPISTATFIREAAATDMYEIAAGRIAQEKAARDEVRSFGGMMVKAHTDTSAKLKTLVSAKDKNLLAAPLTLDQEKMLSALKDSASGGNFDALYIAQQTDAHLKAIEMFTAYADHGEDAKLKTFAAQTLPRIQDHLQMARNLSGLQMAAR